jgi:hypothetical protein
LIGGGFEGGWRQSLSTHLVATTGLFAGGAGGASAPVGGGLMLRDHLGLRWEGDQQALGMALSRTVWPSGDIRSNQVAFTWARRFEGHPVRLGEFWPALDFREQRFELS